VIPSRVLVLTTGGTIASVADGAGRLVATKTGPEVIAELEAARGQGSGVECVVEEFCCLPSPELSVADMWNLAMRIRERTARSGLSGVVVTHGTDVMEESAFLTHLTHASEIPVVFTGAQRVRAEPGFDGIRNLNAAIELAAALAARPCGVMIAMDGLAVAAFGAQKVHTNASRPFRGIMQAEIDDVLAGRARHFSGRSAGGSVDPTTCTLPLPRVSLVKLVAGMRPEVLSAVVQAEGAAGLVIEGFGMGSANRGQLSEISRLVEDGTMVVMTTRCAEGSVLPRYAQGGGADVQEAGALLIAGLPATQLRLATAIALASCRNVGLAEQRLRDLVWP